MDFYKLLSLVPINIATSIAHSFLPSHPQPDDLGWGLSANGQYSVKLGYCLAQGLLNSNSEEFEFDWIWNFKIPPKIKNFLWKACHDDLPTKDRMEKCKVFLLQQCCVIVLLNL